MKISFAKLDGEDGKPDWGVRVAGDLGSDHARMTGQTVDVTKRDGSIRHVTLGERIMSWNGRTSVYKIAR